MVATVGLLTVGAGLVGWAGAASTPSDAAQFARQVLAEAVVPPGGAPTTAVRALDPRWESGTAPTRPADSGIVDLHELFLYDEPATSVASYVHRHLPPGAQVTGVGTLTGLARVVSLSLPVAGPHEYLAMLEYTAAPTGTTLARSELRVDSLSVWVGTRPADEHVALGGAVVVTGFESVTASTGGRSPVTVTLRGGAADAIVHDFDSLTGAPTVLCMEDAATFELAFRPPGSQSELVAQSGCTTVLSVARSGEMLPSLSDRGCALLEAVASALPRRAVATRLAAAQCARAQPGRT